MDLKTSSSPQDIAREVRDQAEASHAGDLSQLNDTCVSMSQALFDTLAAAGHEPQRIMGQYLGADADYVPNSDDWEGDDESEMDMDSGFCHWWVELDGKILDVCADQFHPSRRESFRVLVVDANHASYLPQLDQPGMDATPSASKFLKPKP